MRRAALVAVVCAAFAARVSRADDAASIAAGGTADDGAQLSAAASIGAGAQGAATYGALELRFDAVWPDRAGTPWARLGLGARGVWDDGTFRRSDWSGPASAITIIRDAEISGSLGDTQLAAAAGGLAPAHVMRLADGYRAALDDRWRTGLRTSARSANTDGGVEIDDLLDPALVAGNVRYAMAPPWSIHAALAIDPAAPTGTAMMAATKTATALELGFGRLYEGDRIAGEAGGSIVAEIGLGVQAVLYGDVALERAGIRWTGRADLRAGNGSVGALFGPLYRIERLAHDGRLSLWDRARAGQLDGAGGALSIGAATRAGWLDLGARVRPGLATLFTVDGGLPLDRRVQAGLWAAVSSADAAGAAELRIAWARRLFSAFQAARIYRLDPMDPQALWSLTAWFGATTD